MKKFQFFKEISKNFKSSEKNNSVNLTFYQQFIPYKYQKILFSAARRSLSILSIIFHCSKPAYRFLTCKLLYQLFIIVILLQWNGLFSFPLIRLILTYFFTRKNIQMNINLFINLKQNCRSRGDIFPIVTYFLWEKKILKRILLWFRENWKNLNFINPYNKHYSILQQTKIVCFSIS